MKKDILKWVASAAVALSAMGTAQAETSTTVYDGVCTNRSGSSHATTVLFFGHGIKNVIATTNELQRIDGEPVSRDTDVTFDVWKSNGTEAGECIGSINVKIDGGTNQRKEVVIEDLLPTPWKGQGIVVRTGQLDARNKFDIYVDIMNGWKHYRQRQTIWNNFTGMPNNSRLMSTMRFMSGQHLAIYFSGTSDTQATALIQIFRNDGSFVGVATQKIGEGSVVITNNTRSLKYFDEYGNRVPKYLLPADGDGYLKVLGQAENEIEASCVVLYARSKPNSSKKQPWRNYMLRDATITFARRNGNNDPLDPGE